MRCVGNISNSQVGFGSSPIRALIIHMQILQYAKNSGKSKI